MAKSRPESEDELFGIVGDISVAIRLILINLKDLQELCARWDKEQQAASAPCVFAGADSGSARFRGSGDSSSDGVEWYVKRLREAFENTSQQKTYFELDRKHQMPIGPRGAMRGMTNNEAQKKQNSRFTAYLVREYGGRTRVRFFLRTGAIRELLLPPLRREAEKPRGRRGIDMVQRLLIREGGGDDYLFYIRTQNCAR